MSIFTKLADLKLADLTDEQIAEKLAEYRDLVEKATEGDADTVGELSAAEIIAELEVGVEAIEGIVAEQATRAETDASNAEKLAELKARALGKAEGDDDTDEDADADASGDDDDAGDGEGAETREAVVAGGNRPAGRRRALPAAKGGHAPREKDAKPKGDQITITASAVDREGGYDPGAKLTAEDIAKAIVKRKESFGQGILSDKGQKVPVVRISSDYGEKRTLDGNGAQNQQKMRRVMGKEAIVASGGICAPVTPYYGLMELSVPSRPVRDALPRFNADRGGIRYAIPPTLADISTAVGLITAANDARGGTFSQKSCQHVDCPDIAEVDVSIIYHCVEFGNLQSRTFPEQVAQFNELVLAAFARKAEVNLLDGISGASTDVTAAQVAGAVSTLLGQMITAAAGYRSRNRMDPDAPLRVLAPAWVLDALQVDVLRGQFMRFDGGDATFTAQLAKANINISWYMDSPTGLDQVFGAQADGALLPFPEDAVWYMFAEGSFMFLDGGTLELGIVRDSTLNSTNDYQIFGESFENVAYLGIESLQVTSTFCANGEVTAPAAADNSCLA
jgi:hypothetical protein